jgi:hypothetical protein
VRNRSLAVAKERGKRRALCVSAEEPPGTSDLCTQIDGRQGPAILRIRLFERAYRCTIQGAYSIEILVEFT